MNKKLLVTGVSGFIGMHVAKKLLDDGFEVVGVDNMNDYYDTSLKVHRLEQVKCYDGFRFIRLDLADRLGVKRLFKEGGYNEVIHLAAQAGVRYSLENPMAYVDSNLVGMMSILEGCRHSSVEHLVYASSSSVYGISNRIPFSEEDTVDRPVSLYAATKKSNELMAHSYSHLYRIPTTGLRFFTVYGPAGRPDMAPWLFADAILNDRPIKVYNNGEMERDFTYVNDVVDGILNVLKIPPNGTGDAPYRILNIGNNEPVKLMEFISATESACGRKAKKIMMPMQLGDVPRTYADIESLFELTGFKPKTSLVDGMGRFVEWYKSFRGFV